MLRHPNRCVRILRIRGSLSGMVTGMAHHRCWHLAHVRPCVRAVVLVLALLATTLGPARPNQNSRERSTDLSGAQLAAAILPSFRNTKVVPPVHQLNRNVSYGVRVSKNGAWLAWADVYAASWSTQVATMWVKNLDTGATDVVASATDHTYVAGGVSDDGRYVLFEDIDGATNTRRVLRWDRIGGAVQSVMIDRTTGADAADNALGGTRYADMSADGTKVAFHSDLSNLVAGDTNGQYDMFVRNMTTTPATASTTRVSLDTTGNELSLGISLHSPTISGNGSKAAYVANFVSGAFGPLLVNDLATGTITREVGEESGSYGAVVGQPVLSHDGSQLLFSSSYTDLPADPLSGYGIPGWGPNGPYVLNLTTGTMTAVPTPPPPSAGYYTASELAMSGSARWVALSVNHATTYCTTGNAYLWDRDTDNDGIFDEAGATKLTLESFTNGGQRIEGCTGPTWMTVGNDATLAFSGLSTDILGSYGRVVLRDSRNPYKPQSLGLTLGTCLTLSKSTCVGRNATNLRSDPVNTATGALVHSVTDLASGGIGVPFVFTRTYNSNDPISGPMGQGWTHSFIGSLSVASGVATVRLPDGQQVTFAQDGAGWKATAGVQGTLTGDATSGWTLTTKTQLRYAFSAAGRLASIKDRNGQGLTITHNGAGNVDTVTDAAGRVATLGYAAGLLTGISMSDGRTVGFGYTSGRLTTATDADNATSQYAYVASGNGAGLLDKLTDADGRLVFDNAYDASGRVVGQVDGEGNGGMFSYQTDRTVYTDDRGKEWTDFYDGYVLVGTANPYGDTWRYVHDELGNVVAVVRPDGAWEGVDYDERGNATRVRHFDESVETTSFNTLNDPTAHTNAEGETVSLGYDANGNPASVTDAAGTTYLPHDSLGRPSSVTDPTNRTTTFGYDAEHNLSSSTDNAGNKTTYDHDAVGRRSSTVSPKGNEPGANPADFTTTQTWSPGGDPLVTTTPEGRTMTNVWSPGNVLLSDTDPSGRQVAYTHDLVGNVKTITAPGQGTTTIERDGVYNVTARTDGNGHRWEFGYDDANRLAEEKDPLGNRWTQVHNSIGLVASATDPEGNNTATAGDGTVTFTHDLMGRITKRDYSDPATSDVLFEYDKVGRRAKMDDATGTSWLYGYDDAGRPTTVDHGSRHWDYTYDAAGRVASRQIPELGTIGQAFDSAGRPADLTFGSLTVGHAWDADGQLDTLTLPNGVVEDRTWTRDGLVQRILTTGPGATVVDDRAYTYNPVGNPLTETRPSGVTTYDYDTAHRLKLTCEQASCPGALDPKTAWTYDNAGNRLTETTAAGTTNFAHDNADRLTGLSGAGGARTLTWNRRGERTSEVIPGLIPITTRSISWFQSGLVKTVTQGVQSTSFVYDGDGRRYSETSGSTTRTYTWDGSNLAAITTTAGTGVSNTFLSGPTGLLATFTPGQPAQWHHGDNVGTTMALTGPDGAVDRRVDRDAWGNQRSQTITDPAGPGSPLSFTGELHDASGLVHLRARQYDTRTGSFLSRDPVRLGGPAVSDYAYVGGRPTAFVDPSGMCFVCLDTLSTVLKGAAVVAAGLAVAGTAPVSVPTLIGVGIAASTVATVIDCRRGWNKYCASSVATTALGAASGGIGLAALSAGARGASVGVPLVVSTGADAVGWFTSLASFIPPVGAVEK